MQHDGASTAEGDNRFDGDITPMIDRMSEILLLNNDVHTTMVDAKHNDEVLRNLAASKEASYLRMREHILVFLEMRDNKTALTNP